MSAEAPICVTNRPSIPGPEYQVYLEAPLRLTWSWPVSVALHFVLLVALALTPRELLESKRYRPSRTTTTLVAPPRLFTQRSANEGKVASEVTLENLLSKPRVFLPPGQPALTRSTTVKPPVALPEPPKIDPSQQPMRTKLPDLAVAPPPPQIQLEEKPKLMFESPAAASLPQRPVGLAPGRRLAPPPTSVSEATRSALHGGGGTMSVGDLDIPGTGGLGAGINLPGSQGRTATSLELMSDPMGTDFKPYLIRILAAVKRNWLSVIPESARMGRTGRVQLQFIIARDGSVPKLVIAAASGTDALDRAAVAGVSATTPFPPLPNDFRGREVRLQFTFTYNAQPKIDD